MFLPAVDIYIRQIHILINTDNICPIFLGLIISLDSLQN